MRAKQAELIKDAEHGRAAQDRLREMEEKLKTEERAAVLASLEKARTLAAYFKARS